MGCLPLVVEGKRAVSSPPGWSAAGEYQASITNEKAPCGRDGKGIRVTKTNQK